MENWKQLLYKAVWDAREICCGSDPQPKDRILRKLGRALSIARQYNVPTKIYAKLEYTYNIIEKSKSYYDRLPADRTLCDLLNEELGE